MNRREFMKGTAAAGAAAVLPISILPEPKEKKPSLEQFINDLPEPKEKKPSLEQFINDQSWLILEYWNDEEDCFPYPSRSRLRTFTTFEDMVDCVRVLIKQSEQEGRYITFSESETVWKDWIASEETVLKLFEKGDDGRWEVRLPRSAGGDWRDLDIALQRAWVRDLVARNRKTKNG
jgi:hypothetical protein